MKRPKKEKELDVDFIGGMGPLTDEDRKAISAWIQARKKQPAKSKTRTSPRKKTRKTT